MSFIKGMKQELRIPLSQNFIDSIRILSQEDGFIKTSMTRAAEANHIPRIGRLDLYEEPDDVINHYKEAGFDIVEEMSNRKGNCLWVRARAIDADVANENGDYFSWEELIKEREIQSDRHKNTMPAYKSFEGVPIYTNHENSDIQKAKGKVVFAEIDEEEKCVYCTFYIDADAYPDIAKSIQLGTITDVSMGCFPAGTLVMTRDGYKNIENIEPYELLVDGKGNITKIRNKQEVYYSGPLTEIYIEGGPVIRCTPNHPLLKIKTNDQRKKNNNLFDSMILYSSENIETINEKWESTKKQNTEFIEAGDLKIGDLLISNSLDCKKYKTNRITAINKTNYDGFVYNFEVENDDHTYLVDSEIISKNCSVEFSYCSVCGNKAEKESEWCFGNDTLITTSDGTLKRIDEIQVGDHVITHLGNIKKVIGVMNREINEDILQISSPLTFNTLNVTKNHPLFVSSKNENICKRCNRQKCRPGDIGICYASQIKGEGEQTCFSNDKNQEFKFLEAGFINKGDFVETPVLKLNDKIGIDNNLASLIGYYLSEGHLGCRNNQKFVQFSIADNEIDSIGQHIIDLISKIEPNSKYTPKIIRNTGENGNGASIRWTNHNLAKYLNENCPGTSTTKRISFELFNNLNKDNIYNLLGAFIDGDGYQNHLARPGFVRIDIASPNLASQLRLLLNSIGIRSSYLHTTQKGGPTSRDKRFDIYCLGVPAGDLEKMSKYSSKITEFSKNKKFKGYWTERGLAQPITDIKEVRYSGTVYNLEVEDDNSYVANGISVHNCDHLKTRKGKKFSGVIDKGKRKGQKIQNELVYEDNHDIKFIELSIVSDGAFNNCTIDAVLPYQEVLNHANQITRTASDIKNIISKNIEDLNNEKATVSNLELVESLDSSNNILEKIEKFSSSIMNNLAMQKEAGMQKEAYMNVLDTLNDILNKIEAVIISLLSRKDNIDLSHVAKISKAMADLQQVISDLIDDGVGSLSDAVSFQQDQQMQGVQQPQQQQANAQQDYTAGGGNVGRVMGMGNMQTQPVANIIEDSGMSTVPFQFTPNLEPSGFQQAMAHEEIKWNKFANQLQDTNLRFGSIINSLDIQNIDNLETIKGGKSTMSKSNERVANALMNKIATVVEQPIIASRENEKYKIVISDKDGNEISGYIDGQLTDWQPSSLTIEDIDLIRENRVASVTQKLMDDFVGFVKTAAWNPYTPGDITKEEQLADKRTGAPDDKTENRLTDETSHLIRKGNPDDKTENRLTDESKTTGRQGNPDDKTENRLTEATDTILGRRGNPDGTREEQLSDVRKDVDDRVLEQKLQSRRSSTPEGKVATAALNALASAICDSGASPSEIINMAQEYIENDNFIGAVASCTSTDSYNKRIAARERADLNLDNPSVKPISNAFIERIADVFVEDDGIAVDDLKIALSSVVAAPRENMKKILGKLAREQAHNVRMASNGDKSRGDLIKGAVYAAMSDAYDEPLDRSHLKIALFAVAETAEETKATPDEIFEVIANIKDDNTALVTIETERLPNAMASRIRDRERKEFWGRNSSINYSEEDIEKSLFASLADYTEAMEDSDSREIPSHLVWQVTKKLANGGENAKILVDAAIQARNDSPKLVKDAASLTDRTDTVREIRLSMDEIPNSDPSSDEFAETVRDYAIAFLQNKGYRVDPETFNFTKLTVNDKAREIVAIVQSSIVKEFGEETFSGESFESPFSTEEPLLTSMALQQRKNNRDALIREAQAAPGGAAGGAPAGGMPAAPPPSGEMPEAPGGGPGISSLLGGNENEDVDEEDANLDNTSIPGKIKPIGSICPGCGSENVDLASGKGECRDCNTQFDLSVSITNIVTPDEKEALPTEDSEDMMPEGLGAALAPPGPEAAAEAPASAGGAPGAAGGAPGAMPPMGGGMPMAASVSWYGNAEQFVKLASDSDKGSHINYPRPPGTICLACGNKKVRRANSQCFCDQCGTVGKIDIENSNKYEDKMIFRVSYLLPPLEF